MQPGDVFADRFEIERISGVGGMGTVYRVRDRETGSPLALKVLHGESSASDQARFKREARLLSELRHPGIVRYDSHGMTPVGEPYLVMEWLAGEGLSERLFRGTLSVEEAIVLGLRVAEALSAAHERGVLHRDIKPDNLFLADGMIERVKVLDFGIARSSTAAKVVTRTGVLVGTVGYMAPEQVRGELDADGRVDVFSLGCVLFEALTGRPPFEGQHVLAVLAKILIEDAPRLNQVRPDVPKELADLVAQMLSKDPSHRPQHGAAVVEAFRALQAPLLSRLKEAPAPLPVLTDDERRLVNLIVVGGPLRSEGARDDGGAAAPPPLEALRRAAQPFGVRVEHLAGGSVIGTLAGQGSATDQAARAARCALAIRGALPAAPLVLATGRGVFEGRLPVGELIDRAVGLLRGPLSSGAAIRLDDVTAGLLDDRFEVAADDAGFELRGERLAAETATRTLLGKPTPCVGRDRELSMLEATFAEAKADGVARAVIVTGPPGAGKSRVRYEFVRSIRQRGDPVSVWIARGDPMSAASPLGMIAELIRGAVGLSGGEPLAEQRDKIMGRMASLGIGEAARVAEFLGELVGAPSAGEESAMLRAARGDPMLMGNQMRRAFEALASATCDASPLLIVLDDLHWGDLPSVHFIDAALRVGRDKALMILALARPDIHDTFPKLWAEHGVQEIPLGELSRKACERLIHQVLGERAGPDTVERVIVQASGNAFYLEELIRAVASGKSVELPETVLAMAQARIEALEPEARRVMRAGSVFGGVFWASGVAALLGDPGGIGRTREWLITLSDRELIARSPESRLPGEEQYAFRHALVREAAYGMLTDEDRALGHRLAGAWLEHAGEQGAMTLAEHFERGGDTHRASVFYGRAAEKALAVNDLLAVIARAERGVAGGASGEALGRLRRLQAEAHRWRGESADALRCAAEALSAVPRGSVPWCAAAGELAGSAVRQTAPEPLDRLAFDLRAVLDETSDIVPGVITTSSLTAAQMIACARVAAPLYLFGRRDMADELIGRIGETPDELLQKDPLLRARIFETRSIKALSSGDLGAFIDLARASVSGFMEVGDIRNAAVVLANLALGHSWLGEYAAAEEELGDVIELGERLGLTAIAAAGRQNLCFVLARRGRLDDARELGRASVDDARSQGDRRAEAGGRIYLAIIAQLAGDIEGAARDAAAAVAVLSGAVPLRAYALAVLSQITLATKSPAKALSIAEEAMALLTSLGGTIEEGEAAVRLAYAEALLATRHPLADEAIEGAARRLEERAAQIHDPAWRESFRTRVPEHAKTLELAEAWRGAI